MQPLRKYILTLFIITIAVAAKAQTVFKTPSGAKDHLSSCRTVKNVSEEISVEKAKDLGLTPCKICKPANIYGTSIAPDHKAQGQGNTVQCEGKTKSGTRCRHKTRIANGYCFQHQP